MLNAYKQLTVNQFEASLRMLDLCADRCPEELWNQPVAKYKFCQVVFHTLFFADFYLGINEESFREQSFHREHGEIFHDYEEFEDRPPVLLYDKAAIKLYMGHCREKMLATVAAETAESLQAPSSFPRKAFSRAELHVYNMRHIQHHAAQLSLRLRLAGGDGLPWVRSGWVDVRA